MRMHSTEACSAFTLALFAQARRVVCHLTLGQERPCTQRCDQWAPAAPMGCAKAHSRPADARSAARSCGYASTSRLPLTGTHPMTNRLNLNERLRQLREFNTELRQQLEAAEACIPPINDAIEQLARVGLVHDQAFLGPIVYERGYSDRTGPHTSGQVLQSALLVSEYTQLDNPRPVCCCAGKPSPNTSSWQLKSGLPSHAGPAGSRWQMR